MWLSLFIFHVMKRAYDFFSESWIFFIHSFILFSLSRLKATVSTRLKMSPRVNSHFVFHPSFLIIIPFGYRNLLFIFTFLSFSFYFLLTHNFTHPFFILVNLTQMWFCLSSFVPLSFFFTHSIIFALFSFTWVPSEDAQARDECEIKIGNSQCCTRLSRLLGKWNNFHDSCVGFRCIFLCCYVIWSLWPCP